MLQIQDGFQLKGYAKLYAHKLEGTLLVAESDNVVTVNGRSFVARVMAGEELTPAIAYLALGSDSTDATQDDTQLGMEAARNEPTTIFSTGIVDILIQAFFTGSDVNVHVREAGTFVSPSASMATSAANTGRLFSRATLTYDNSGMDPSDLTLEWRIRVV